MLPIGAEEILKKEKKQTTTWSDVVGDVMV